VYEKKMKNCTMKGSRRLAVECLNTTKPCLAWAVLEKRRFNNGVPHSNTELLISESV
jgi:hypothetical protein